MPRTVFVREVRIADCVFRFSERNRRVTLAVSLNAGVRDEVKILLYLQEKCVNARSVSDCIKKLFLRLIELEEKLKAVNNLDSVLQRLNELQDRLQVAESERQSCLQRLREIEGRLSECRREVEFCSEKLSDLEREVCITIDIFGFTYRICGRRQQVETIAKLVENMSTSTYTVEKILETAVKTGLIREWRRV